MALIESKYFWKEMRRKQPLITFVVKEMVGKTPTTYEKVIEADAKIREQLIKLENL